MRPQDNPFRVERIDALPYRLIGTTWDALAERFTDLGERAAVVGPHGSGKTTFLRAFGAQLAAAGRPVRHARLRDDDRRIPPEFTRDAAPGTVFILDSAGCLGPLAWRRFLARVRGRPLLITVHEPGRLATLYDTGDAAALDLVLDDLLGNDADAWRAEAHVLLPEHEGSIRDVLRTLYDVAGER